MPAALINYECASYRQQAPIWRLLEDVYTGDRAWLEYRADGTIEPRQSAKRYLPQLPGEEATEYKLRLLQSHFDDRFAQSCRDFVGLVFNKGVRLEGVPAAIKKHWANLDGAGLAGDRLCGQIGMAALRLGHTFTLVDFPEEDDRIVSLADSLGAGRAPCWNHYSPLDVINWRYRRVGGRKVLSMVVLRYSQILPDGDYGESEQTFYLQLTPGRFDTFVVVKNQAGKLQQVAVPGRCGPMGRRLRGVVQPFDHIPLVCLYGGDRAGFFSSNPTLLSLAKLNLVHYQVNSDHRQKMHYCSFPTPVRTGGQGEDLTLGPRRLVDVPLGGGFGWAEPNSQSLAMSRIEVKDIESAMDFLGADYLVKPSDRQAASTTMVQAKKIESELYLFASDFAAGISECLRRHAQWLGLDYGGTATLETKFFENLASDPQLLLAYARLRELGDISTKEMRQLAAAANFFPDSVTLEDTNGLSASTQQT
ncbi:DUF4055 domain-containing protein [Nodosilinea sp. LEGE 06152]|uniref:DUF4055 domain-containing protein n=1 Tax=Nodosilinea sp. LEGE 06152 TaxID=2777966 RepID=UPI001881647E|nr:DUF4055 domain-containing protein [Nodosilinea sp. LEGE 06152]MBE9157892.1 DUF4055 domain-containing protein [Nodosilinea sp. LEGE 06152]